MTQIAKRVNSESAIAAPVFTQFIAGGGGITNADDRPRKITVRLTDEEFAALDQLRARLKTKFQQVGLDLFMSWLARGGSGRGESHAPDIVLSSPAHAGVAIEAKGAYTQASSPLEDPDHEMLARIKASGIPVINYAIRENLRSFDALRAMVESLEAARAETTDREDADLSDLPADFVQLVKELREARADEGGAVPRGPNNHAPAPRRGRKAG